MWCLSCFHVKTAQQTFMKFSSLHRLILIWIGIFKLYPTFRTELNIKLIKIRRDLTTEKEEKNSSALVTDTKIMQPVYAFIFLSSRWQKREKTQSARAQAFVLAGKKRFEVTNFEILCAPRIPSLVPYIRPVRIEKKLSFEVGKFFASYGFLSLYYLSLASMKRHWIRYSFAFEV